jgi:hypothetical protein
MTDELKKRIDALSEKHFLRFGRTPTGDLKFKWMRTDEMFGLFKRGHNEEQTPGGLYIAVSKYEKRSFVDMYGRAWTVAKWNAPIRQGQWLAEFGTEVPWPREGFYHPIENVMRHIDLPPDDAVSEIAAAALARHLKITPREHYESVIGDLKEESDEKKREWREFVDDITPAFGNETIGGKGNVSFRQSANN